MKFHRTYHSQSWSEQARQITNKQLYAYHTGMLTENEIVKFFHNSYRHSRIRYRAAKRFGRIIRKEKMIKSKN